MIRLLLFLLAAAVWLYGQAGTGTISGTVADQSGAMLPGAKITVTNTSNGFVRSTLSAASGDYSIPGLLPGTYDVAVEAPAFKRSVQSGIVLQVDQNARIDVRLEVGTVAEVIEVTGQTALLQTEQSSVGAVVDHQKIVDFPLNGRNFVQLGLLLPGVNTGDDGNPPAGCA